MGIDEHWPLFGLRVVTPRLELRLPRDDDLAALARLVREGLHDPAEMPFDDPPWTDEPSPGRERGFVQRQWLARANWAPEDWRLRLMAVVDGAPVGMQDVMATRFDALGVVTTYSWLVRREHGKGIGKEMRAAVLHLAFEGLGARAAQSEAFETNFASRHVSLALGYEENGRGFDLRRGIATPNVRYIIRRERWLARRRGDVAIEGLEACRALFGVA